MNPSSPTLQQSLHTQSQRAIPIMLMIGIACLAANLRAPLTSVGPLVDLIRSSLHISNTLAGMITTLPLFAFALFSPVVPALARRWGTTALLLGSMISLTMGIVLRSSLGSTGLFLGTAILGLSIAVGNVMIPSLIKKEFADHVGMMMGVYSVSMNLFAAIASGISIPLAAGTGWGWTGALRIWAVLGVIAILLWLAQAKQIRSEQGEKAAVKALHNKEAFAAHLMAKSRLWTSLLAWQVTIFMGLQSMVFYCMVAWLPNILIEQGISSGKAGWMLSLMQLSLIPITFVVSILAGRKSSQCRLVTIGSFCTITGLCGLLLSGAQLAPLWIIILGIGGGFTFSLAMMFFSLRTQSPDQAARLSAMAQSVGYLLAAFGPMLFGYLHDVTGSWSMPLIILMGAATLLWISGLGASRHLYVDEK